MPTPLIHCTGKLAKLLGVKSSQVVDDPDGWNAHVFPIAGRKCIILTHKATFFSLIKLDVRKADLVDFGSFFNALLREQLLTEWPAHVSAIDAWLGGHSPAALTTSDNDRRTLGVINHRIFELELQLERVDEPLTEAHVRYFNWSMNDGIIGGGKDRRAYLNPEQEMAGMLGVPYDRMEMAARHGAARERLASGHLRVV